MIAPAPRTMLPKPLTPSRSFTAVYDGGTLDETRHFYYRDHSMIEQRVDGTADTDTDVQQAGWVERSETHLGEYNSRSDTLPRFTTTDAAKCAMRIESDIAFGFHGGFRSYLALPTLRARSVNRTLRLLKVARA